MWQLHHNLPLSEAAKAIHDGRMKLSLWAVLLGLFIPLFGAFANGPFVPNPKLTPGDVLEVTKKDICVVGYSKKVRNVPAAVRRKVFMRYGIIHPAKGAYEVDHLISLELGGSNSIRNLFPQSYKGTWNARVKDGLENRLHMLVCKNKLSLAEAQHEIASDWIGAYKIYFKTAKPLTKKKGAHGRK